jgi:hypothetical protein
MAVYEWTAEIMKLQLWLNEPISKKKLSTSWEQWKTYSNLGNWHFATLSIPTLRIKYEGVSQNFRTGRLERELQMVQLSATLCRCIAILWVSLMSFVAITLCVASQRVFIVISVYFVMDSVRKLLDPPSYSQGWEGDGRMYLKQDFDPSTSFSH